MAETLGFGWEHVPWPGQLETVSDWTVDQRKRQATLLESIREMDRAAVTELEAALKIV